jgi:energy-coupling factor transporter ATP-binding protein EcfA2
LNVIVGDNGSGKTSLLEAIFLALCSTTQIALRYRQERGLEGAFTGTARRVEEAIFADLFYDRNTRMPISIVLDGDGDDKRSVAISRGTGGAVLPFGDEAASIVSTLPIKFSWTNSVGNVIELSPTITSSALSFPDTGEDLPDFFFIPANTITGSVEQAQRFSDLNTTGRRGAFIEFIRSEYPWIENLSVEAVAGAPAIFAKSIGKQGIPLPAVSSGINRLVGLLLCMATREKSVLLVDEIEVGTHYSHHQAIWSGLLKFMREYDSQLFVTTHSLECLQSLVKAAGRQVDDIALWRVERGVDGIPEIRQFSGDDLVAGVEFGQEVR